MNRPQRNAWIFLYTVLLTSFLAMLLGFDGKVSLRVTPFNFSVVIDGYPRCVLDLPSPEVDSQSQAQLPQE
ncbi:hypothetical protein [Calothrix sp. NIES-2100]|uniref:hypothetical protein n=1 Tax=Calothrix sp. NIES-2100 TaxID=1954172 RepID=UPI0030DA2856